MRVGIGYDSHRFTAGRPLVIGGVNIPYSLGLAGHSDADVLLHAVGDALLGAAALGDIGTHFPDTDPQWIDVPSSDLLQAIVGKVAASGFSIENVDATVIAEQPQLSPYIEQICSVVADLLAVPACQVSIKGKTNEKMGWLGRGEGIACLAVALLSSRISD